LGLLIIFSVAIPAGAVNMTLQQTADGSATGVTPPAGLNWIYFAHHTHTDYSDGRDTVQNRILEAASFGADIVSITDHNTIEQCNDPWFIEQDGCIPMRGDEWGGSGRGHACVLDMTGNDPLDVKPGGALYTTEEMIPLMLARGATILINHPFEDGNPWPTGFAQAGIRGVGVWTTPFPNADARGWWSSHIAAGRMLVGIGESDNHLERILCTAISNSLVPCNYVLAASKQPADVQAAVEAGRIAVAGSKDAARTFVWCDQDGDGVYETPMGTNIVVTQPKRLRFRVEVYDGALLGNVMVYSGSGGVKISSVNGSPCWRVDYEADVTSETKDYFRSELRGAFGIFQSFSNPIYINYALTCSVTGPASPTNSTPIAFALTFNRPVTGLTAAGINVTNGTKGALSGSGNTYTLPVTPSAQGTVTCRVSRNAAWDGVGNGNLESNPVSVIYDSAPPTCSVTGPASPTGNTPIAFALTFSEPVTGLTAAGISVANGTKGALSGSGNTYTLPITPLGEGAVTCQVSAGAAQDGAGNGNVASNLASVTYDSVGPTCVVTGPASPTSNAPIVFTLTFSEPVTGLTATGIDVTNSTKGALSGSGNTYMLPVAPSGEGAVTCQVQAASAQDAAGNGSLESNLLSVSFDSVPPTCVATGPASPTNNAPIVFTLTFSEPVTGLTAAGIDVTNGAKGVLNGGDIGYLITVTPVDQGPVTCRVLGNAAQDAAGNGNLESNLAAVSFDSVPPTCVVTGPASPTDNTPIVFTLSFSEPVTGLTATAINVTNGTKDILSGSDNTYTLPVTPLSEGAVTCQVQAASAQDAAGNGNLESNLLSVTYDSTEEGELALTAPNGGEAWGCGTTHTITWQNTSGDAGPEVRLALHKAGDFVDWIVRQTENDGTYNWIVWTGIDPADDYTIRVQSYTDSDYRDVSDAPFSIQALGVKVPNGGEVWTMGNVQVITWGAHDTAVGPEVRIGLHYGLDLLAWINRRTDNDGTYPWKVPAGLEPGVGYRVRVQAYTDNTIRDLSDTPFTLVAPPLLWTSPDYQAVLTWGETYDVTWVCNNLGAVGPNVRIGLHKGGAFIDWIRKTTPNDGEFSWTVGSRLGALAPAPSYRLRLQSYTDKNVRAMSPAFTIAGP